MPYIPIGPRPLVATADTTSRNRGNYTNWFNPQVLSTQIPYIEIYHVLFTAAPLLASVNIYINTNQWSFAAAGIGGGSEWDPVSPMLLRPGDEVFFFWAVPVIGNPPPSVTCWLRYDPTLQPNKPYAGGF